MNDYGGTGVKYLFDNQGISLSSKYSVTHEFFEKEKKIRFIVEPTEIPEHFFSDNIEDIKLYLGKNGAGKTTLLKDLLYRIVGNGLNIENELDFVLIFADDFCGKNEKSVKKLYCYKSSAFDEDGFTVLESRDYQILNDVTDNSVFKSEQTVFYTSALKNEPVKESRYSGCLDLSTNGLLYSDDIELNNLSLSIRSKMHLKPDYFSSHITMEYIRNVSFGVDLYEEINRRPNLKFRLPNAVWISPSNIDIENAIAEITERNESERNKWNKIIPTDFFNKFKLSVLLNHVRAIYSNASMRSNLLSRLSFLYDVDELQKMGWDEALKRYSANNQDFPVENDLYRKVIESLLLLDDLQDFQKFLLDKYPNMNRDVFYFDLSLEMHRKILEEFVDKCVAMSVLTPFFTLLWRPQSSGEENFIKLFSRIYYSLRSEKRRNAAGKNKNIHLFIDEADLYLHPECQRCWLDEFVNIMDVVLKRIYGSSVPKIQLFMSTHSPYIISDFPKENITLLKQSIETKQVEIENSHSLSPFGGNLYDLLSANFFVDNSIGSFSEELIGKAVEYSYNPNSMTDIEKQKMEYVIKSIGDPIIGSMIEEVK